MTYGHPEQRGKYPRRQQLTEQGGERLETIDFRHKTGVSPSPVNTDIACLVACVPHMTRTLGRMLENL